MCKNCLYNKKCKNKNKDSCSKFTWGEIKD